MKSFKQKFSFENLISIFAILAIIVAWFIGSSQKQADLHPYFQKLLPEIQEIKEVNSLVYSTTSISNNDSILYLSIASSHGYGGELQVLTLINASGAVLDFLVINQKETQSFFTKVMNDYLIDELKKSNYQNNFELGDEIDGISGATYTSRALATAIGKSVKNVAEDSLNLEMNWKEEVKFEFGGKEILILFLFLIGFLFSIKAFPDHKFVKYLFFIFGMLSLGFYYNGLLSMPLINKFILGIWPRWDTHFYGYLLMGMTILMILFSGKNVYCSHVCPFGSTQKCLELIGGTYKTFPSKISKPLVWIQRFLSLSLIIWALIAFNPSAFSYEVFGAFFQLYGTSLQFIILIIILILSLFYRRPWCNYLCPVRPVLDFIRMFRNRVIGILKRK
jgi:NosR/NirI family transcriptional regulator, nitrous oxide reductase regulator